jgi:hypothetical protein
MVRAAFGRTSEIAEMSWDEVRWDEHAQVATVCWYEMKTSKTKTFALAAGKTRHDDVYLKGGDWLATNQRAAPAYDSRARRDPLDISQADFVRRNLCFYCHVFDNKHCHKTVGPCTPQHYIHFVTERLCTPMLCRYIAPEPAGEGVVSDLVHCSHCNYMSMNDNELYIAHAVRSLTECIKYI